MKQKNMSTILYEDPDGNPVGRDKELIASLTDKLETEPDYPLPEGFNKIKEMRPVIVF